MARGLARAVAPVSDETPSPFAGVVLDIRICDIEIGPNVRATVGELDELVASIGKQVEFTGPLDDLPVADDADPYDGYDPEGDEE